MDKRKKISLAITTFVVFLGIGVLIYVLEKGIPLRAVEETISNFALVTYKDENGQSYGPISSNTVTTTKTTPVQNPTLRFNLKLQGRSNYQTSSLLIKIYPAGGDTVFKEYTGVSNNSSGEDTEKALTDITSNYTADIWVKLDGFLAKKIRNVALVVGQTKDVDFGTLFVGDYNNDNVVNAADFAIWIASFRQAASSGDPKDINQDGTIDAADFAVWVSNFRKEGD